ncbi:MAG TPA: YggT family protein [Dehalococcoidia bacterium]|nr:YggT family protein [Dehalococcoidia bacterium]
MGILVKVLTLAVIGRALLSWFPVDPRNPLVTVLHQITEPILAPLRQVIPRIGMFDITPIVAIFILYAIDRAITSL